MRRTPEKIVELVTKFENSTTSRRERMDKDYSMWLLHELPENLGNPSSTSTGPIIGPGYKHYTSNEPRTYADKTVSIAAEAEVIIRVRGDAPEPREERKKQNDKERFAIGVLTAADERLAALIDQPSLQDQLAWYAALRGWVAVRALLRKRKDGSTFVDIKPFDPRNVSWGMGSDGPLWVCLKSIQTVTDIKEIYGKTVEGNESGGENDGIPVYDFYDDEHNQVVTDTETLKSATRHGSSRVPIWIGAVGAAPHIRNATGSTSTDGGADAIDNGTSADYGESIYVANRLVYAQHNFIMSVVFELMSRARSPGVKVFSQDGTKTLPENPFKSGTELALRMEAEDVKPLEQIETTKDAAAFAAFVQGEMQRGSLPHSVFGELAFQLSGFAINSLRQGVGSVVSPTVKTMKRAYFGIISLLVDQYVSGQFKAMEVAGLGRNRKYFSEEITPERVKDAGGNLIVEVLPELPQDEPAKHQMAQLARTPNAAGEPLFGDRTILEDILNRQDPDSDRSVVVEQLADASSPLAQAVNTLRVATELEREDLIFAAEAHLLVVMRDMLQQTQGQPQNGQQNGGTPGLPAQVLPGPAQGLPQPAPTSQQGPLVPTGTPRPGARNGAPTADELTLG